LTVTPTESLPKVETLDDILSAEADDVRTSEFDASAILHRPPGTAVYRFHGPSVAELYAAYEAGGILAEKAKLPLQEAMEITTLARCFDGATLAVASPQMHFLSVAAKKSGLFFALVAHLKTVFGDVLDLSGQAETEKKASEEATLESSSQSASNTSTDTPGS
jgi:hypothetical protein